MRCDWFLNLLVVRVCVLFVGFCGNCLFVLVWCFRSLSISFLFRFFVMNWLLVFVFLVGIG